MYLHVTRFVLIWHILTPLQRSRKAFMWSCDWSKAKVDHLVQSCNCYCTLIHAKAWFKLVSVCLNFANLFFHYEPYYLISYVPYPVLSEVVFKTNPPKRTSPVPLLPTAPLGDDGLNAETNFTSIRTVTFRGLSHLKCHCALMSKCSTYRINTLEDFLFNCWSEKKCFSIPQ